MRSFRGGCGRRSRIVVFLVCALLALACADTASANWSGPVTITGSQAQYSFGQDVGSDGRGAVVWSAPLEGGSGYGIYERGVTKAGTRGATQAVSQPLSGAVYTTAYHPSIHYASDGTATIVWLQSSYSSESCFAESEEGGAGEEECGVDEYVKARQIAPDGTLSSTTHDLYHRHAVYPAGGPFGASSPAYMAYGQPAIAPGPGESLTVIWGQTSFGEGCEGYGYSSSYADDGCEAQETIQWVRLDSEGKAEGVPQTAFSSSTSGYGSGQPLLQMRIGTAADGTATVLFSTRIRTEGSGCWGGESAIEALQISVGGEASTAHELDSGCGSADPRLVVQSDGTAVAAWSWQGTYSTDEALYTRIASDGTPGEAEALLGEYKESRIGGLDLARGLAGSTVAVWAEDGTIDSREIPPSGSLGSVRTVATPAEGGYFSNPRIGLAPDGTGAVVWEAQLSEGGYATGLQGTELAADGTPGNVRTLLSANRWDHGARISAGGDGSVMASWRVSVPHENKIQAVRLSTEATTSNDDFADAQVLDPKLPSFAAGSNEGATKQTGEPNHGGFPGGASVWYSWTPEESGPVSISTCASGSLDTLLGVYTGAAVDELTTVASADGGAGAPCAGGDSEVRFEATAGTTYEIAVDGKGGTEGSFGLKIAPRAHAPANDDFADATNIPSLPWSRPGTNVDASKEIGEPDPAGNAGGASVWYSWTAAHTGEVLVAACGQGLAHPLLGVYTGGEVGALTPVASADGTGDPSCGEGGSGVRVDAVKGTTYKIAVDGRDGREGRFFLRLYEAPANDDFANAQTIIGIPNSVYSTNAAASKQTGEPEIEGNAGGASVWYSWTPSENGTAYVSACMYGQTALLGVYTGSSLGELSKVGTDAGGGSENGCYPHYSEVGFEYTAGTRYYILLDGENGAESYFSLSIESRPPNDDFANAQELGSYPPQYAYGSNRHATRQSGEPEIEGNAGGASVWYSWTPTESGTAFLSACISANKNTLLGVYTGSSLASLSDVGANVGGGSTACNGHNSSEVQFEYTSGTKYYIAVDGEDGARGYLSIDLQKLPTNDDFENAQPIGSSLPQYIYGSNYRATRQAEEPEIEGNSGGASVWYSWTPTSSGKALVSSCMYSSKTALLGIYTSPAPGEAGGGSAAEEYSDSAAEEYGEGTSGLGSLKQLAAAAGNGSESGCYSKESEAELEFVSGTTYYIAIDGEDGAEASFALTIETQSTGSISGTVTSAATHEAVPTAHVCANSSDGGGHWGCASTNSAGEYEISKLPPGEYKVEFGPGEECDEAGCRSGNYLTQYYDGKAGWEEADPVSVQLGETASGVDAELVAGGQISGTVTGGSGNEPISGSLVCIYIEHAAYYGHCTYTDAEGHYSIGGLPAGEYEVQFDPPYGSGYVRQYYGGKETLEESDPVAVTLGETTPGIDAELLHGSEISGTVTAATGGEPVEGVEVCAGPSSGEGTSGGCAYTEKEGHYTILGLRAIAYKVSFYPPYESGYATQYYDGRESWEEADPVTPEAEGTAEGIDAQLSGGASAAPSIVEEAASGITSSSATLEAIVDPNGSSTELSFEYGTSESYGQGTGWQEAGAGSAEVLVSAPLAGLEPNTTYHFRAVASNPAGTSYGPDETFTTEATEGGEGGQIAGTVTAASSGDPLAAVFVCATNVGSYAYGCAETDGEGNYTIEGLSGGEYKVGFFSTPDGNYLFQYYADTTDWEEAVLVPVEPGGTTNGIDAQMHEAGRISGTVTAAGGGAAIEGIEACAYSTGETEYVGCAETDGDGNYTITGLQASSYRVRFSPGYVCEEVCLPGQNYLTQYYSEKDSWEEADLVAVEREHVTGGVDASLQVGGQITGTVSDVSTHEAIEGVEVCAFEAEGLWYCDYSDGEGDYDITGVPSGSYVLKVFPRWESASAYAPQYYDGRISIGEADAVAVTAGATTSEVEVHLRRAARVAGRVTAASGGAPVEGVLVCAEEASGEREWGGCKTTDSNGEYAIGGLPPNSYKVVFEPPSESGYPAQYYDGRPSWEEADSVSLAEGEAATGIDAALGEPGEGGGEGDLISGTVRDSSGGAPIEGVRVCAEEGPVAKRCVKTNGEGNYTITGLPEGEYRVGFSPLGLDYLPQFYDGRPTSAEADVVFVHDAAPTTGIDAELQSIDGRLSGRVTEAGSGSPIEGVEACAFEAAGGYFRGCGSTDGEGEYTIEGLPEGEYKIQFSTPYESPYAPSYYDGKGSLEEADGVPVAANETTPGIDAALDIGGRIAGTVSVAGNGPLAEAEVCATAVALEELGRCSRTDAEGHYTITGLPEGEYRVEFWSSPYSEYGYLTQFYDGRESWEEADPVPVELGETTAGIDAELQPTSGSISGKVTSAASGDPIPAVAVCAYEAEGESFAGCAETDSEGSYVVHGLAPGSYKVGFYSYGGRFEYAGQYYSGKSTWEEAEAVDVEAGSNTSGVDAALGKAGTIAGTVTAATDGTPIEGVQVCAFETGREGGFHPCAVTDAAGEYTIGGLPASSYKVSFYAPYGGYEFVNQFYDGKGSWAEGDVVAVEPGAAVQGIDAELAGSSGRITGTVTDAATHKPIGDVEACAYTAEGDYYYNCGSTDEEGHYTIEGLPSGEYKIQFSTPYESPYAPQFFNDKGSLEEADPVSVTAGETTPEIDAEMHGGGQIAGTVTAVPKGQPVEGAQVCAYEFVSDEYGGCAYTDSEGHYTIGGLASGKYRVSFYRSGEYGYLLQYYDGKVEYEEADPVPVSLGETTAGIDAELQTENGHIAGTVTDAATEEPVEDTYVCAYREGGSYGCAWTGEEGRYEITGLPAGEYAVQFDPPYESGYAPQLYDGKESREEADQVAVAPGETTPGVDAALQAGATIAGVATDALSGEAVDGVEVCAEEEGSRFYYDYYYYGNYERRCTYTGEEGHYVIGGLPAGEYKVSFYADNAEYGYLTQYYDGKESPEEADPVSVALGETTSGIDAELQPGSGRIAGTVTDASSGEPIKEAEACLYTAEGSYYYTCAYTGEEGHYAIGHLPEGQYKVEFYAPYGSPYAPQFFDGKGSLEEADSVSVSTGETTDGIDAQLQGGGQIAGTVTAAGKGPLSEAQVCAYGIAPEEFSRCTYSDSDGHYSIGGLPEGKYQVEFWAPYAEYGYLTQYYDGKAESAEADPVGVVLGETTAGIDAELQPDNGHIAGTVTAAGTDEPVEDTYVCAYRESSSYGCAWTGEEGRYAITNLPAGEYAVQFYPPDESGYAPQLYSDKGSIEEAEWVPVAPGETTPGIDAVLQGGGTIAGTATDALSGEAVDRVEVCAEEEGSRFYHDYFDYSSYYPARRCTDTGKEGHYSITGLPAGEYKVSFYGGNAEYGYLTQYYDGKAESAEADPVPVALGETTSGIDAELQTENGRIAGTVTDASTHKPIGEVEACTYTAEGDYYYSCAWTDSEGHYAIGYLPEGQYKVEFDTPYESPYAPQFFDGKGSLEEADPVSVTAGETTPQIDAEMHGGGQIAGTVTAAGKGPLAEAEVCAYGISPEAFSGCDYTDAEGHYTIGGLAAGEYRVGFYANGEYGYLTQYYDGKADPEEADPVPVSLGETTAGIDAVLQPENGRIAGTVTDAATEKPIEGVRVCASETAEVDNCVETGSEGAYEIEGLPEGEYTVSFFPVGLNYLTQFFDGVANWEEANKVAVSDGATSAGIDAELQAAGRIMGTVTDATTHEPIEDVEVCASNVTTGPQSACGWTGEGGQYTIIGMYTGEYRVEFFTPAYTGLEYLTQFYDGKSNAEEADLVPVAAGETIAGIDAEMQSGVAPSVPTNTSPPTIAGTPQQGQTLLASHGTWTNSPTAYTDHWLRCDAEGEGCEAIPGASGSSYVLGVADVDHTLVVRETASNAGGAGEAADSTPTAKVSGLPLHADAGENLSAVVGEAVTLNGSASTPAGEIDAYLWSFGDGESAEGVSVSHAYAEAGTYKATLTVKRGGEEDSQTVNVKVLAPPAKHVSVEVTDESEAPIPGAQVLYLGPDGTRTEALTNGEGDASLAGLPDGTDAVYVWKSGFKPATAQVEVSGEEGEATVQLAEGAVVATTLQSHEMDLEEIEEAGIDTSDPANNQVYEFEVALAFTSIEFHGYINEGGSFVGTPEFGGGEGGGGGGGDWSCSPSTCSNGEVTVVATTIEGHPVIEWLVLHGKASVLKQFFQVSMVIQNLADEPFELTEGSAKLNLPSGMSLAPTAQVQSLTQAVAPIAGGSSATAEWVVRGDTPGEYYLSAEYNSTLEPFEAPVQALAASAEPLKVWGADALSLKVRAESGELVKGKPYHVQIGVMNKADVPLYNVGISIDSEAHEHFIFQPDQQFDTTLGELPPGETRFAAEIIVVPDGGTIGTFDPGLSHASFAGEEVKPGEGITEIAGPPIYALESVGGGGEMVHLHWASVPGAEGYEVFSTPDLSTPFGKEPAQVFASPEGSEAVGLLPAEANDAYVPVSGEGPLFYAVSSLIEGRLTLDKQVISAEASGPEPPAASAPPTISGEARKGQTLTSHHASWEPSPESFTYTWLRCDAEGGSCEAIEGAAASTYTLTAADVGHKIKLKETATNKGGSGESTSAATAEVLPLPPTATAPPTISGEARKGQTLTSHHASWEPSPESFTYTWLRCDAEGGSCEAIEGASSSTYTLTAADVGHKIKLKETATNKGGSGESTSAATAEVLPLPPTATAPPTISGEARKGQTLTSHHASWEPSPESFTYTWLRCDAEGGSCEAIEGASSSTYTLTAADVGHKIKLKETATNKGGSGESTSAATAEVLPLPPTATAPPTISGEARKGQTLTSHHASWEPSPESFTYTWLRCDAEGGSCEAIEGASSSTYTLTAADVGHKIKLKETATNKGGSGESTSAATAEVLPLPPTATAPPTISGEARKGQTLTSHHASWEPSPESFTYTWLRCDAEGGSCEAIEGAAASTYTLTAADVGHKIKLKETATNKGGSGESTSAATAEVLPLPPTATAPPTISGEARKGQTLTSHHASWEPSPESFTYTWLRCDAEGGSCEAIEGASSSTYTLTAADVGHKIKLKETATNKGGSGESTSAATAEVLPLPPTATAPPTISGEARKGQTLTSHHASWEPSPESFTYTWLRCDAEGGSCEAIEGAAASTYTLTAADVGHKIKLKETATNKGGSGESTSAATAEVLPLPPTATAPPTISGEARKGQTLTSHHASWEPSPESFTYTWLRCDAEGGSCEAIEGASSSTYTLTAADVGHKIKLKETATNKGGSGESTSATTAVVFVPPTPVNVKPPTISGVTEQGQILSEHHGTWENSPDSYSYSWLRCSAAGTECSAISGAGEQSYVLAAADVGHTIKVTETATNGGGSSSPATSTPTGVVTSTGSIEGKVTTAGESAIAGISVRAYEASGGERLVGSTETDGSGHYSLPALKTGSYKLEFSGSGYITQFYNGKATLAAADAVAVTLGTATRADATMKAATGSISGTVSGASGGGGLGAIKVTAYLASTGVLAASSETDGSGKYTITGLKPGEYKVQFSGSGYTTRFYNGKSSLGSATKIAVSAGAVASGIDANMVGSTASLKGKVLDSGGHVIAGALVIVYREASGGVFLFGALATTGAEGTYAVSGLAPGIYKVEFSAAGYLNQFYESAETLPAATPISLAGGASVEGIDASLGTSVGEISGKVSDGEGSPLGAVEVSLYEVNSGEDLFVASTATEEGTGEYALADLAPGTYKVEFSKPGYITQFHNDKPTLGAADELDVHSGEELSGVDAQMALATGALSGTVTGAASEAPIAGVEVDVYEAGVEGHGGLVATGETDEAGHYTVAGLPAGPYAVQFNPPAGGEPSYRTQFFDGVESHSEADEAVVHAGETTTGIDAALEVLTGQITGTATASGSGVSGLWVIAYEAGGEHLFAGFALTGSDGKYTIAGLQSGHYKLEFRSEPGGKYAPQFYDGKAALAEADEVEVAAPTATSGIDVQMESGGTAHHSALARSAVGGPSVAAASGDAEGNVSGKVTDAFGGAPLAGIQAVAYEAGGEHLFAGFALTDSSGEYTIEGLQSGHYKVGFSGTGYLPQFYNGEETLGQADEVEVTSGETTPNVDAAMHGGGISGTVSDSSSGLAGAKVRVYEASGSEGLIGSATTASDGTYAVSGLEPGEYKVQFSASGYTTTFYNGKSSLGEATKVPVSAGATASGIDATMAPTAGAISGTVQSGGSGLAGATVSVYDGGGTVAKTATTASDGTYAVSGLEPGEYKVQFSASGYTTTFYNGKSSLGEATKVPVSAGATASGIDATMAPTAGAISGTVQSGGSGLAGATVSVYDGGGTVAKTATTASDGTYAVSGLEPGEYKVQFSASGYTTTFYNGKSSLGEATKVPVSAGATASGIDATMAPTAGAISGTVQSGGSGLAGATVSVYDGGGTVAKTATTASDGTYAVSGLEPGEYKVQFSASGYTTTFYNGKSSLGEATKVPVSAGATASGIDATMAGATGRIAGTVKDAGGEGLAGIQVIVYDKATKLLAGFAASGTHGEYVVENLPEGSYAVEFTAGAFGEGGDYLTQFYSGKTSLSEATPVAVEAGKSTDGTDATMRKGGALAGKVTALSSDGDGLEGVTVTVYDAHEAAVASATSGSEGAYGVNGLAPGEYKVGFSPAEGSGLLEYVSQFYSGKSSLSEAQAVEVEAEQTKAGVDAALLPHVPLKTAMPTITGEARQGQVLTEHHGSWEYSPDSFAYQWSRCDSAGNNCAPISGATAQTYTLTGEDVGDKVTVQETATNAGGPSAPASSGPTSVIIPLAPVKTAMPTITGEARQGQVLTEHHGSWEYSPDSFAYQWSRCDSAGNNCAPISGATAQTYTLTGEDVGDKVTVQETATNAGGPSAPAVAVPTAVVAPLESSGGGGAGGGGSSGSGSPSPSPSPTPSPSPAPSQTGTAKASGASVKGNAAVISLGCAGPGACSGVLELVVQVKETRVVYRQGHRHVVHKTRTLQIGKASFSIPAGAKGTVKVHLTGKGKALLRKAGKHGLKAQLKGTGIAEHGVKLRSVNKRKRKHRKNSRHHKKGHR